MIMIRMAARGRKNSPLFTIVATDSASARDGKFLKRLGQYDPSSEQPLANLKVDEIKKWVKNGAHLSDTVRTLFKKQNISLE